MNLNKGEFWDITANAFRGCSKVSAGCDNCWALRMAWRHAHNPKTKPWYEHLVQVVGEGNLQVYPVWSGQTHYDFSWAAPLRVLRKRKRVFLNGMGDMFHEANLPADIQHCLAMINQMPQHLFIVATKRPAVALYHLRIAKWYISNLILLTSTEDQAAWDKRVPYVADCKPHVAAVGAICEPLIGPINEPTNIQALDWLLVGGETGPGARMMDGRWNLNLMASAKLYGIPYFFKQFGGFRGRHRHIYHQTYDGGPKIWKSW
jgi:protein gp37